MLGAIASLQLSTRIRCGRSALYLGDSGGEYNIDG